MFLFALIILAASSAFTEGAAVDHVRLRRTPTDQLETRHQDYDHSDSSSFSISYDNNEGSVYKQTADGSLYNQTYANKQKESAKEQSARKFGNVRETGPNATSKNVHYNIADNDKLNSKMSSKAGHKDVIKNPVFEKGPDGKMVISKANETFHQVYNHTTGAEAKDKKHKGQGKTIETVGGAVKQQQHYDNTLDDTLNKHFKKNVGGQIVRDQGGNFSNTSYKQTGGGQSGKHLESRKGSQDLATKQPKTTNEN